MADWKTLCSELLEVAEDMTVLNDGSDARFDAVAERVRAELAHPALPDEGELTDGELNAMWNCSGIADEYGNHTGNIFEFARAAIAFDRIRRAPVLKEKGICPACEGSPTAANNPCAVCGCSAAPSAEGEVSDEGLLRAYGLAKRDHCYEGPIDDWPKRAERAATVAGIRAAIALDRSRRVPVQPADVIIDGVKYVPVSTSNPNVEHIATALIQLYMGEGPWTETWQELASLLRVVVTDDDQFEEEPSVMETVSLIVGTADRLATQNNNPNDLIYLRKP